MVLKMEGYIFINSDPGMVWEITETVVKIIKGVKMAHAVTGEFDIIAYAEFSNIEALAEIIEKVQALKGVQRTRTAVAIPARLK